MNNFTIHDDYSGKSITLEWSEFSTLLLSAEYPSDLFSKEDRKQLKQIATTFREFFRLMDYENFDIRELETDDWEAFLESTEKDWNPTGVVEEFDSETKKLLNEF